jgi:hypothetical protein
LGDRLEKAGSTKADSTIEQRLPLFQRKESAPVTAIWLATKFNPSSRKSFWNFRTAARAAPDKTLVNPIASYFNLDYVRTTTWVRFGKVVLNYL